MSTRATYEFKDERGSHVVYKHWDGYPEGAREFISNALPYAWPLPRFEADEFAAAFIAGNKVKGRGGDLRLTAGRDRHGDTEYHYVVTLGVNGLHVEQWEPDGWGDNRRWHKIGEWSLEDFAREEVQNEG